MDKATAIREILKHRAEFEAAGVRHVYLFGSVMRATQSRVLTSI
ncbi:MAG: hypothetical protein QNJ16_04525 [Rhodobacter sp.]|nr:hypothetical protein [Rhodobacter sp.]